MKTIKNITDLRNDLLDMYIGLRNGSIERKDAVEANNTAGKIMASIKLQLENCYLQGVTPNIEFLNCEYNKSHIAINKIKKLSSIKPIKDTTVLNEFSDQS